MFSGLNNNSAAAGNLFGTKPAATPATGGLFGSTAAPAAKPAPLSLFGSNTTTSAPATATAAATTAAAPVKSLFGTTTATAAKPMSLGTTPAAPATGGLFGSLAKPAAPTATTSAFGATAFPTQTTTQTTAQQALQNGHLDMAQVRGSTKFEDLGKDVQDGIVKIDNIITVIMGWKAEIEGFLPAHEEQILSLGHDVAYLERKYAMVQRAVLQDDVANIQELRTMSTQNIADAHLTSKAVDNLKLPASYHVPGLWTQSTPVAAAATSTGEPDLISYFNRHIESLGERERKLRGYVSEIQAHMPRVEHGLYEKLTQLQSTPGMSHQAGALEQIKGVLLDVRGAIVKQAVEVAKTREALMTLEHKMLGRERI